MTQDKIFNELEGNAWFKRNKAAITDSNRSDYPALLVDLIEDKSNIKSVLELGCSNGFRLAKLKNSTTCSRFVGVDCSEEALDDGRRRYDDVEFYKGLLNDVPLDEEFDLVIVNFVLCWVSRKTLAKSIAEIDRVTKDGGFLIIGDHFPDNPQRRRYHHNLEEEIFTYKQNYGALFEALGFYKEIARITFNHDHPGKAIQIAESQKRAACMLLKKSLHAYYPVI